MKILLIEDDIETASYVRKGLTEHGHTVDHADNGRDGLFLGTTEVYDLMIVDRMLPHLDGLKIVKTLRGSGTATPILFLTNLGGVHQRVEGLDAGGDDYVVKPFAFVELLARLNALARRNERRETGETTVLRVHTLEMDLLKRAVSRDGRAIDLLNQEFKLLEFLMRHQGEIVTRTMLLESVWDFHFDPKTNIVETHMSRLRSKIETEPGAELIHTVRGSGYVIRAPG